MASQNEGIITERLETSFERILATKRVENATSLTGLYLDYFYRRVSQLRQ